MEGQVEDALAHAAQDRDENIRCQAVRMARRHQSTLGKWLSRWIDDPAPSVRRELAIALHEYPSADAATLWAQLALKYDAGDRWFLEALGIGADDRWDEFLAAWMARVGNDWKRPNGVDLIWRSRADQTPELMRSC
jgi:hypothetical protein